MSRHGYVDDWDGNNISLINWRGAVTSAIRGRRGQAFLRELATAMDAMPEKRLIKLELVDAEGQCCTLGVLCKARGLDITRIDPEDADRVSGVLGIARAMSREIAYENDEGDYCWMTEETPEARWRRMRRWVDKHLIQEPTK